MNSCTKPLVVKFDSNDIDVSEIHAAAFDILFQECGIETFFRNNKKDVELSGNGKRDSLGCCCTGLVSE